MKFFYQNKQLRKMYVSDIIYSIQEIRFVQILFNLFVTVNLTQNLHIKENKNSKTESSRATFVLNRSNQSLIHFVHKNAFFFNFCRAFILCERASTLFKDKSTDVTLNTTTFITLTLEDGDDQDPRFSHVTYEIWLPEENASVVWSYFETTPPIYAYDMDLGINATVEYAIVGNGKWQA